MSVDADAANRGGSAPDERGPRWDTAGVKVHHASVAAATSTASEVHVFVGTTSADVPGSATSLQPLARIALNPRTAKRLQEMLVKLIPPQDREPPAPAGSP